MTSLFFKEKKEAIFCCRRFLSLPLHAFPPVFQTFMLKSRRNHKSMNIMLFPVSQTKAWGMRVSRVRMIFLEVDAFKQSTLEADSLLFNLSWSMKIKDSFLYILFFRWQHLNFLSGHGYKFITVIFSHPTPYNYDHDVSFNWQSWRGRGSEVDAID